MNAATISRLQSETSTASRQRSARRRSMSSSSRSIRDGSLATFRAYGSRRTEFLLPLLLLGSHREWQRPVLTRGVVDGQPPLVAAWLQRQRCRVHGDGEVERRPRFQAWRTPDLELAAEGDDLI